MGKREREVSLPSLLKAGEWVCEIQAGRREGRRGGGHLLYVPAGGDLTHANFPLFSSRGSLNYYSKGARFLTISKAKRVGGDLVKEYFRIQKRLFGRTVSFSFLELFHNWGEM